MKIGEQPAATQTISMTTRLVYERAFTLIELLAVIFIMVILGALFLNGVKYVKEAAARKKTEAHIHAMSIGIERYKVDQLEYPDKIDKEEVESAQLLYQVLSGDGSDAILGVKNPVPSDGKMGSEGPIYLDFVDSNNDFQNMVRTIEEKEEAADGSEKTRVFYWVVDGWGTNYQYAKYDPENPEKTRNATYDLWSYGGSGSWSDPSLWITNW